jgi:DNA repair photolyase
MALVKCVDLDADVDEALYNLMELRAEIAVSHLFSGFDLTEEDALELLENLDDNSLTQQERDIRDRLVAGIDNLIEFSVCAEYQAFMELPDEIDMDDPEKMAEYEELSDKYHLRYAGVENSDIEYSAETALKWVTLYSAATMLTYMTMNDERVRPWHRQFEGYSAPRDLFPDWLIPPIEWGCRCHLEDLMGNAVENKVIQVYDKAPKKPKELDNIFSESLAKCGRIFGKSHPYFKVRKEHKKKLASYVERLKEKYYA